MRAFPGLRYIKRHPFFCFHLQPQSFSSLSITFLSLLPARMQITGTLPERSTTPLGYLVSDVRECEQFFKVPYRETLRDGDPPSAKICRQFTSQENDSVSLRVYITLSSADMHKPRATPHFKLQNLRFPWGNYSSGLSLYIAEKGTCGNPQTTSKIWTRFSKLSDDRPWSWNRRQQCNRPFAQLLPGLETGHPVTVGQSPTCSFSVSDGREVLFLSPFRAVLGAIHVQMIDRPSPDAPSLTQTNNFANGLFVSASVLPCA